MPIVQAPDATAVVLSDKLRRSVGTATTAWLGRRLSAVAGIDVPRPPALGPQPIVQARDATAVALPDKPRQPVIRGETERDVTLTEVRAGIERQSEELQKRFDALTPGPGGLLLAAGEGGLNAVTLGHASRLVNAANRGVARVLGTDAPEFTIEEVLHDVDRTALEKMVSFIGFLGGAGGAIRLTNTMLAKLAPAAREGSRLRRVLSSFDPATEVSVGTRALQGAAEGVPFDLAYRADSREERIRNLGLGMLIGGTLGPVLGGRLHRGANRPLNAPVGATAEGAGEVIPNRPLNAPVGAADDLPASLKADVQAGEVIPERPLDAPVGAADDLPASLKADVQAGEVIPERPLDAPVGATAEGGFFALRAFGVGQFFKREFTTAGDLPASVFQRKIRKDGWIGSHETQIRFTLADFRRASRKAFGTTKPSEDQLRQIDDVLKGDATPETIPEALRPVVSQMREELDALSQRMIDSGVVEGDLVATVTRNLGVYTTRSYRVFDDPDWALKVAPDVRNRAKALLRSEYPTKTEDEIEGLIASLLYRIEDGPVALILKGNLGSKDLSMLRRRKDIAPEIRALWGEFRDPRVNYARSVTKMSNTIANQEFLTEVRTEGLGTFFHEQPLVLDGVQYKAQIAAEESSVMSPLNGLYTTPEINQAFKDALEPVQNGPWLRAYMKVNGVVKYSKTVGSVTTHIRNVIGNIGFAVANGHVLVYKAGTALRAVATQLASLDDRVWRDYYRHVQELGVVDQSAHAGELRAAIRDASAKPDDGLLTDPDVSVVRKGLGIVTDLYRAEDDVWKIYAFENEKARYARARPDLSEVELEQLVAGIVRNTYPTYSQVPRAVRAVRQFPLTGTFVSFPSEVFRVGYNTIDLALSELRDPALRSIGAQRMAGIMVASTGVTAATVASRQLTGVTRQEEEDIRSFLPPWSENSNLLHLGKDADGKYRYVDVSYTDPFSYLRKPIIAAMRGEDWQSSLVDAALEAFDPFLSEEILAERLLDVSRNTTQSGGRVFNPADHPVRQFEDIASHVLDALEPGTISSARRIAMGISGKTTIYGRSYDPTLEALAVMTGHRLSELDVRQAFAFRAREHNREIGNAQRILTSIVTRRGEVNDAEVEQAFREMNASRNVAFRDAHEDAMAALRLGMTRFQIVQALRVNGMSERNAAAVYAGRVPRYLPSDQLFQGVLASVRSEGGDVPATSEQLGRRRRLLGQLMTGKR